MKLILLNLATAKEDWAELANALYLKKIKHYAPFEVVSLKPKKSAREDSAIKKAEESQLLLEWVQSDDYVILFDERGKSLDSLMFSKKIEQILGSGKKRLVFVIGGAYGVTEDFRQRSDLVVTLSPMVMNHVVAQVMALEQIYRAYTIMKGLPYHNI